MLNIKDHNQNNLFDPWEYLGPKRRNLLETFWPGLFKNIILPILPVHELTPAFSAAEGRPTKELHTCLGVVLLQNMLDLTDKETIYRLAFDTGWHYALNLPEESDDAKYISLKTLYNVRQLIIDNGLEDALLKDTASVLQDAFDVNTDKQRLDSVHIKSNMKNLGRIGILVEAIKKFLANLKRNYKEEFDSLPQELTQKYVKKESDDCFAMVKPSESRKTLQSAADDLFELVIIFKGNDKIENMYAYKLISRILEEQCNISESCDGKKVEVKPPKEVSSDSVQNPSDPDAGYSGHKGQGYQVQVMETYCESEDEKQTTLNLITHVEVESADESDANALIPAIDSTKENGLCPEEVLADAAYGSDENCQEASQRDVEVIAPVLAGNKKEGYHLEDFDLNEEGEVLRCPQGHKPIEVKKRKNHRASFDSSKCNACPMRGSCIAKKGAKYYYVRYSDKDVRLSNRRQEENEPGFKSRYRYRSGVEATMSEYDRRTGVKQLRVRGFKRVKLCAVLKAVGLNVLRAASVRSALMRRNRPGNRDKSGMFSIFEIIKEQFELIWAQILNFCFVVV